MPTASRNSGAFTLFELIIVVILIGILYGVFINKMQKNEKGKASESVTLETLRKTLARFPAQRDRELICTEPCEGCAVYIDGHAVKMDKIPLFKQPPKVWEKDRYGQYRQIQFLPLTDSKRETTEVCFRYKLFRNGSGSNYIVQTDETHFYVFKPYMYPVRVYDSLNKASQTFDDRALLPTERRDYTY